MGRIKQVLIDTELEDVAIIHDIPEAVYAEAALEDAKALIEAEACAE